MAASDDHRFKRWLWVKHLFALARWERQCLWGVSTDITTIAERGTK